MVYNLSGIIVGRSKSCNHSNVVAKSVKLICTHVEDFANLTVMHIGRVRGRKPTRMAKDGIELGKG